MNSGIREESNSESVETSQTKCSNQTKKILRGIALMVAIAVSWLGSLYAMRVCFVKRQKDDNQRYSLREYNVSLSESQQTKVITKFIKANNNLIKAKNRFPLQTSYTIEEEYDILFDAPFFATWFCSIWNVLFFPIYSLSQLCCCTKENESNRKMLA